MKNNLAVQILVEPGENGRDFVQVTDGFHLDAEIIFQSDITGLNVNLKGTANEFNMNGIRGRSQKRAAGRIDKVLEKAGAPSGVRELLG